MLEAEAVSAIWVFQRPVRILVSGLGACGKGWDRGKSSTKGFLAFPSPPVPLPFCWIFLVGLVVGFPY